MAITDGPQLFEITDWRRQHATRADDGFNDDRGDRRGIVDLQQCRQFVGQMRAPLRLAARECRVLDAVRMRQMVDLRQQRSEIAAMTSESADRKSAPAHAVIGLGAADEPDARTLAPGAMIGACDLQCRIDGFGTGIGEENMVEARWRDLRNASRQFDAAG